MNFKAIDLFVGEKLKSRRKELGFNQRDLAKQADLSHQQIQKYEKGENRIGASTLYKFAHILTVDVAYFFEGYEPAGSSSSRQKRRKEKSVKYTELTTSSIEELISAYAALPLAARQNMLRLMKNFASNTKL